jgi:hypothetical protein
MTTYVVHVASTPHQDGCDRSHHGEFRVAVYDVWGQLVANHRAVSCSESTATVDADLLAAGEAHRWPGFEVLVYLNPAMRPASRRAAAPTADAIAGGDW